MNRAHKIRLQVTPQQAHFLLETAGAARFTYNWALERWRQLYQAYREDASLPKPSYVTLSALWTQERPEWALNYSRASQDRAIRQVESAYKAFWRGSAKYPKYKKRDSRQSFYVPNDHAYIRGNYIKLPKLPRIKLAEPLRFQGKVLSYTVSCYANKWYVSVQLQMQDAPRPCTNPNSTVGIDVGIKHIAVASDGTLCEAPASLKQLDLKLRRAQRALSRSQRNSNNYKKKLLKKQQIQQRIDNVRQDVTHKFTSTIAKNHGVVVVEDLDLKEMMQKAQHKSLRRSLAVSMMGMILWQLSYKANIIRKADRYFPSTKRCSKCGHVKDTIALSERTYVCEHCGAVIDRDINAAINLSGWVTPNVPVERVARKRSVR